MSEKTIAAVATKRPFSLMSKTRKMTNEKLNISIETLGNAGCAAWLRKAPYVDDSNVGKTPITILAMLCILRKFNRRVEKQTTVPIMGIMVSGGKCKRLMPMKGIATVVPISIEI